MCYWCCLESLSIMIHGPKTCHVPEQLWAAASSTNKTFSSKLCWAQLLLHYIVRPLYALHVPDNHQASLSHDDQCRLITDKLKSITHSLIKSTSAFSSTCWTHLNPTSLLSPCHLRQRRYGKWPMYTMSICRWLMMIVSFQCLSMPYWFGDATGSQQLFFWAYWGLLQLVAAPSGFRQFLDWLCGNWCLEWRCKLSTVTNKKKQRIKQILLALYSLKTSRNILELKVALCITLCSMTSTSMKKHCWQI